MIACGLALNVAVFTLFSHYVLRPFPVRAPASLYEFSWADRTGSAQGFAWPDYTVAARYQGKYMAFHDAMMAHKGNLAQDTVLDLAEDAGIDVEKLKEDMKSPEIDALIDRHYQLADKLGVTGTPAFIIGQELVPGAIDADTMKAKIKQARQS
jgi:predicted DsbA family dithiol-disulfide isomerase